MELVYLVWELRKLSNIHDINQTDRTGKSRADVNAARMKQIILKNLRVKISDLYATLAVTIGTLNDYSP